MPDSSPPRSWCSTTSARRRPSACATATISNRRTNGSSSAITSPPSPARDLWSVPRSRRSSAICPGTLWIIIGAVLGGAVQDFVILFCSMRRDGKSLGQMAREEIGKVGGFTALITVLLIMIILLAVVALVVVNALKDSPWGTFTIAATMPIAVFMGLYLRYWRPGQGAGVLGHRLRAGDAQHLRWPVGVAIADARADIHALRRRPGVRHHHLRISGKRAAGLAAAGASRLPEHLCEARRRPAAGASAFSSCGPICNCRRSRDSSTARVRSSPARSFRSASSPSPAERSPAFTR